MQNPCEIVLMWTNINLDIYQHVSDLPPYLYDTCHNSSQYQLQFLEIGRDFFCKVERLGFIQLQLFKHPMYIIMFFNKPWSSKFKAVVVTVTQFAIQSVSNVQPSIPDPTLTSSSPSLCNLLEPSNINLDFTPLRLPQKTFSPWMEFTINLELFSVQM